MFIKFNEKESVHVTYGDNIRGTILGEGVAGNPSTITIECVILVKGLKHNLLNISELCKKGYSIIFYALSCLIGHKVSRDLVFNDYMIDNIYMLDLEKGDCNWG